MLILGIDPGLSGACALLDHNGIRKVFDIPTMQIPGVGPKALVQRKVDARALLDILLSLCPPSDAKPIVFIEQVGAMGGKNAIQTIGALIRTVGAIEAVLECLKLRIVYVRPQVWKAEYGLNDASLNATQKKTKSLEVARRLFPGCTDIKLAKHHNRAESLLLANYGRMEIE